MSELAERVRRACDHVRPVTIEEIRTTATRRRHRHRHRRRAAFAGMCSVLIFAVSGFAVSRGSAGTTVTVVPPAGSSSVAPLADTKLTPPGWSPVALGNVQISVPSGWLIEGPSFVCGFGEQGMVFINHAPALPTHMGCSLAPNVIEMGDATTVPLSDPQRSELNSIPVTEGAIHSGSTVTDVVRALGMEVDARGPLASSVIATLTHSPLSVVLASNVETVPAGWRTVNFGGLSFSTPADWQIRQTNLWAGCPDNNEANILVLSMAQEAPTASCPAPVDTAGSLAGSPGMVVGSGPVIGDSTPADVTCMSRNSLRICVERQTPMAGVVEVGLKLNLFTAQIAVPGQSALDQIEIGLTGTGITPLEIFDSLRADSTTPAPPLGPPPRPRRQ